jgi:hypothetical protein
VARRSALIAALLAAVLLGHALVLEWLAWQALQPSALNAMATPMFTRLLQPTAPPPPVQVARAVPVRKRPPPGVIQPAPEPAPSIPQEITPTVAPPEPTPAPPTPTEVVTPDPALSPDATAAAGTPTASPTAYLDTWPGDTRLNYRLGGYYRGELHGNAKVEWLRDGERYQTRIDIDLGLVSVVMTSQGGVSQQGLVPFAYEESRAGKRRSTLLQDKIVLDDGRQVPRPERVQDTASQFVELSHRFASGELALEVGTSVSFWMARPGGLDYWTYDVTDKEMLQTPSLGVVEAFHLKPRPIANPRGNITAEMWFAPTLQYLPVRIRVTAGEASLDLIVENIEQR